MFVLVILKSCADDVAWLSKALTSEPKDGGPIDKTVYGGNSCRFRGKETPPLAEAGIGGQEDGTLAVSGRDETEEVVGGFGGEGLVSKLVNEQHFRFFIAFECAFVSRVGVGCMELFDHVGSENAEYRVAGQNSSMCDGLGYPSLTQTGAA